MHKPRQLARRTLIAALATLATRAQAQTAPLKLGILTTLAGPAADGAGTGSVLAARMAARLAAPLAISGPPIELLVADMGDRPDQGAAIARAWYDQGVHAILDVPNSATALAVAELARARNRLALFSGAGSTALIGPCATNTLQWTYNTGALARAGAAAVLAEGGRSWFFLTADYTFGHALQRDVTAVVEAGGGRVLGSAAFPGDMTDFSALLLLARSSGADIIGLACTGVPFQNLVKQASEFGIRSRLAALLCLITNVHAIGLADAQGLLVTTPFYWDLNPGTRAFAAQFAPQNRGIPPTLTHAGVFSATTHLLRCLPGHDPADGATLLATMQRTPADDALFGPSPVRADGSVAHPMHLFRVKSPTESRGAWDYYAPLRTIDDAFGRGACS